MDNPNVSKFLPKRLPKPPCGLGKAGKALWNKIQAEYGIDDSGGLAHLETACHCADDVQRMRDIVATDGHTVKNRFGAVVAHPLLTQIRSAETVQRLSLRALNLDAEPPKPLGRPVGVPNRAR
jgi:hypothetical protein